MAMTTAELKACACQAIDEVTSDLNQISQDIWSRPELYYQEHYAHKRLTAYLETRGFKVERKFHLDTAFRATAGKAESGKPNIAILCEYDALPVVGHGCGHNLIAEVGIGASIGVLAALQAAGNNSLGQLTVLGTPAEEAGGGKVDLIGQGVLADIDAAMMAHPSDASRSAGIMLAMTEVTVKYLGKASHAAGFPWEGVNALDAAVMAYTSLSCLRQQLKPSWRLHGIITNGGAKPNIIPEETELLFYLRTPTGAELPVLCDKAKACFEAAATATGCQVELEWEKNPYTNMIQNNTMVSLYEKNCQDLGLLMCTDSDVLDKATGSTDMGNVSHEVPSIHPHFYIGTSFSPHTHQFREAAGSPVAQPYTIKQAKALAMTAIDLYTGPDLLQEATSAHQADLRRENNRT